MAYTLESLLNTRNGMTKCNEDLIQNTLEIDGVSWYLFAGTLVEKIYVHGKGTIGFGIDTDHLKLFDGSSEISSLYRMEGDLDTGTKFLKLRVVGTYHFYGQSSNADYYFIYELFLFDDGCMYIHILNSATDAYANTYGTNKLTDGKRTVSLWDIGSLGATEIKPKTITITNIGIKMAKQSTQYVPISEIGARLKTPPKTLLYIQDPVMDWTSMVIESYDSSDNTNVVSNFVLPDIDVSETGTKTVVIPYKTYSIPIEIVVKEDVVTEITSVSMHDHYYLNEPIESVEISIKWESGKTEKIASGFEINGFDSTTTGTKELTISYAGVTYQYSIYVSQTAVLSFLDAPKTQYYIGDDFGQTSEIVITFDDNYEETVYNAEFSGYDTSTVGDYTITVTARGLSFTYDINVSDICSNNIGAVTDTDIVASLNLLTNVLTLTGTGATKEISYPYYYSGGILDNGEKYIDRIKSVIVSEGITELHGACFRGMSSATDVSLPSTLTTVTAQCFYYCYGISELTLPESLEYLSSDAFYECYNMVLIILSRTVYIETTYNAMPVKMIKGYLGSTAETYAKQFDVPFQILDKITKLEVTSYPERNYRIGESINKSDIVVVATTEDGTEQTTELYDIAYDFSSEGTKTVTVSLGGQTDTFEVNVIAYKLSELIGNSNEMVAVRENKKNDDVTDTVDGASWFPFNGIAADKIYISGNNWIGFGESSEQLKICRRDGAVWYVYRFEGTLNNGVKVLKIRVEGYTRFNASGDDETALKYELFMFSNGDMYLNVLQSPDSSSSYAGTSSITSNGNTTDLSLNGATADSNINVSFIHQDESGLGWDIEYKRYSFKSITGILVTPPQKTKYYIGEEFDDAGMVVSIVYNDGETEEITDYTISGFDSDTSGQKTICIAYDAFTQEFQVDVVGITGIEIVNLPEKTVYIMGENLDTTGLKVNILYDDGYKKEIHDYTVSELDTYTSGTKTITVDYTGITAEFSVEVHAVIGIRISNYPGKRYYRIGETLDISYMYVNAILDNGKECQITNYNVSELDTSEIGVKTVKVSYEAVVDESTTAVHFDEFSVIVTSDGENPFDDENARIDITIHWPNGEFEDLTNEDIASGSVTLQESICSDRYFIWGGCICNQLTFTTLSNQFLYTEESAYPHGDIEAYVECNGTKVKIFTGTIDSGDREGSLTRRKIIAYDYLYKFRNTDIAWWYKNKTTDKQMILTQKQFRDELFDYLGIEQVETALEYDDALVPDTANANEMNAVNIIKDMCLQNSVFGWMNRDGKFEYRTVKANCRMKGTDTKGNPLYEYFEAQVHFDAYKSCNFKEGRIWYPKEFLADPYPGVFSPGGLTAQEAYENNVYYNRNSFFVGNQDWLDRAFQADEYGVYTVTEPIMPICYGITTKWDNQHLYRAQQYNAVVRGNPLNMVGDTIEIMVNKTAEDGTELQWFVRSYIMSRTLKILGDTGITDTYSANNAPYNGNNRQIGKDTPELSATLFRTRQEAPTISYMDFGDGTSTLNDSDLIKKASLRCIKRISKTDYDALVAAGKDRTDTIYCTYEE